jgi:hypothetical protein
MTIDVYSVCWNEAVLLPFFIEHYQSLGANIIIYDNFSTDGSREIITKAGCELRNFDTGGQIRDDLYLSIKNEKWKSSKAEWVCIVDIDEMLQLNFPVDKYTIITTKGYNMIGMPPSKKGVYDPMYSKSCMFRPGELQEIRFEPGCHRAKPIGNLVPSIEIAPLMHYKFISEEYVYARHKLYQSRLSEINKKMEWGISYVDPKKEEIEKRFAELRANAVIVK